MEAIKLWESFGGQSRDDVNWKQGSFIYSEGIDNISSLQYIQVSRKPKRVWTGDEKISHVLECGTGNERKHKNILVFGYKGHVWNLEDKEPLYYYQGWATNHKVYENSWKPIYKYVTYSDWYVCYFAPKLVWTQENHAMLLSTDILYKNEIDMNRKWSDQIWDKTFAYWDGGNVADRMLSWNYGSVVIGVYIYIYIRFEIFRVNINTWEVRVFRVTSWDIAGIVYSWIFKVYEKSWKMFLWDWKSENPSQLYDLETSIDKIGTMKGLDYFTSKEWIFMLESVNVRDLYRKNRSFYLNHEKFITNLPRGENIISSNGLLYLLEKIKDGWWYRFVVFGNKVSWAPLSYTVWHIAKNYKEVTAMSKSIDWIYIAYEDYDWSFGVDFYDFFDIENCEKQEEGFLILREYYKEPLPEVWKSSKLTVFVDWLYGEKDKVIIEYCADRWEWVKLYELDMNTILGRWKKGMWSFDITQMNKQFNMMTFKITLKWDAKLYTNNLSYE